MKALVVAAQSLREVLRMRALYLVGMSAVMLILLAPLTPSFDVGVRVPLFLNLAFSLAYLASLALAVGLAATALPREMSSRTALNALSRPVSRQEFLIGKYLGTVAAVALAALVYATLTFALAAWQFDKAMPSIFAVLWSETLQVAVIAAITTLLSIWLEPLVNLSVMALIYLILETGPARLGASPFAAARIAGALLPDLTRFDIGDAVAHGASTSPSSILVVTLYGLAWAAFFISLAANLFRRRELP